MRISTATVLALAMLAVTPVVAGAPRLSASVAKNANDLQRAAWACENGAPSFSQGSKDHPRFFLGTVDMSVDHSKPSLVLQGASLSGLASLSNDKGWSNIGFRCALSPDLRQATAFKFDVLSPTPPSSAIADASGASGTSTPKSWYVDGTTLVHGVKESDDRDFFASCDKSGTVAVSLTNTVRWLVDKNYVAVTVSSGPGSGLYVARGAMDGSLGAVMPVFTLGTADPLLAWMAKGSSIHINVGGDLVYTSRSRAAAKR